MQSGTARTCRSTNARNEEKTFSRNGDPARSVGFAATPAVSSGGRTTIRLWRKSPCGANAAGQALRADQKKYCSCACYLRAMEETHRQQVCAWCGEDFSVYAGEERQYCCQNCTSAAQTAPKNFRRIHHTEPESWTRCRGPIP